MSLERLNLTADNPREQIMQIRSYLFQLAEQLENILDAIDEQNFSGPFLKRLNGIESNIDAIREDIEMRHIVLLNKINGAAGGTGAAHIVVENDPGVGVEVDYADGTIILVKENEGV